MKNIQIPLKSSNKKPTYVNVDMGYNSLNNFKIIERKYKLKMLMPLRKNASFKHQHNRILYNRMKRVYNQKRYNNRLKIEQFFSTIKSYHKIHVRMDKLLDVFIGSIIIVLLNIIYIKTNTNL